MSSLEKYLFKPLANFLIELLGFKFFFFFYLLSCRSSLWFLEINALYNLCQLAFSLCWSFIWFVEAFKFDMFLLVYFCFVACTFDVISMNSRNNVLLFCDGAKISHIYNVIPIWWWCYTITYSKINSDK